MRRLLAGALLLSGCSYLVSDQWEAYREVRPMKPLEVPEAVREISPPALPLLPSGGEEPEEGAKVAQRLTEPPQEVWPRLLRVVAALGGELEGVDPKRYRFQARFAGEIARSPSEELGLIFSRDPLASPTFHFELSGEGEGSLLELSSEEADPRALQALLKEIVERLTERP